MESKDREKRLNNVIIFNLPESTSQLKTTRQQHDKEQILEMCTEITLTHIDKKRTLLRRFHHIRENDKFKNIKIDHDKTKQEREESKKLYEEAKRKEAADKSGEYLYRVRGPPWERKIRKIRKSQ